MQPTSRITFVLLFLSTLIACDAYSKDLSRSEAKELVQKSQDFASTITVPLDNQAFDIARRAGVWKMGPGGGWWVPDGYGTSLFRSISFAAVTLAKPLHRTVIEVTGITEGEQPNVTKIAEFKWYFSDLSQPVARYTGVTNGDHDGQAAFRLYDDGWRVAQVQFGSESSGTNSRPFAASSGDISSSARGPAAARHDDTGSQPYKYPTGRTGFGFRVKGDLIPVYAKADSDKVIDHLSTGALVANAKGSFLGVPQQYQMEESNNRTKISYPTSDNKGLNTGWIDSSALSDRFIYPCDCEKVRNRCDAIAIQNFKGASWSECFNEASSVKH